MAHVFTDANFQSEVLESSVPVVVDFWAEWCGPCRVMSPILDEIAEELDASKIKIGKCNVDENQDTSMKYNVMSIPTFLVFKGGQVAEQIVGSMPKETLKARLQAHV